MVVTTYDHMLRRAAYVTRRKRGKIRLRSEGTPGREVYEIVVDLTCK